MGQLARIKVNHGLIAAFAGASAGPLTNVRNALPRVIHDPNVPSPRFWIVSMDNVTVIAGLPAWIALMRPRDHRLGNRRRIGAIAKDYFVTILRCAVDIGGAFKPIAGWLAFATIDDHNVKLVVRLRRWRWRSRLGWLWHRRIGWRRWWRGWRWRGNILGYLNSAGILRRNQLTKDPTGLAFVINLPPTAILIFASDFEAFTFVGGANNVVIGAWPLANVDLVIGNQISSRGWCIGWRRRCIGRRCRLGLLRGLRALCGLLRLLGSLRVSRWRLHRSILVWRRLLVNGGRCKGRQRRTRWRRRSRWSITGSQHKHDSHHHKKRKQRRFSLNSHSFRHLVNARCIR